MSVAFRTVTSKASHTVCQVFHVGATWTNRKTRCSPRQPCCTGAGVQSVFLKYIWPSSSSSRATSAPPLSQTAPMAPPKLATLLLLLFLLCLSQSSARDHHPLDPLTPSEISTIRSIIKSSHLVGSSKSLAFHYVGLDEPDKPDVLAWQSGRRAALPRRAFVIARADRRTHELYIDISNSSITSDKIYDGFGYPAFTFEDMETASALPFNHTSFVESVRKRGLELKDVVCLAFTVGWYGEERQERRLASLMCFVTGETINLYMRPLEGVKMLVDLDAMEIVEYKDRKVVPVPKAAGTDYRASKQEPPFGPQTKPGVVVQPEGKGFKIDGHVVRLISDLLPPPLLFPSLKLGLLRV